jgi:hypothetical protein
MAGESAPTRAEPAVRDAATPEAARADYWDADEENEAGEEDYRTAVPEVDQDAPPFATAPFATVPRLNRVRSTPIPPEDDED